LTDNLFVNREEAENASELEGVAGSSTAVSKPGTDALGVQGARINRSIRTFADACVFPFCFLLFLRVF
jgi:hypothetical protein